MAYKKEDIKRFVSLYISGKSKAEAFVDIFGERKSLTSVISHFMSRDDVKEEISIQNKQSDEREERFNEAVNEIRLNSHKKISEDLLKISEDLKTKVSAVMNQVEIKDIDQLVRVVNAMGKLAKVSVDINSAIDKSSIDKVHVENNVEILFEKLKKIEKS